MFLSLMRGWVVLGIYHREIVTGKDAALAELRERAAVDAETMRSQASTIANRDGVENVNIKLLQAFRAAAEGDRR